MKSWVINTFVKDWKERRSDLNFLRKLLINCGKNEIKEDEFRIGF